MIRSNYHSHSNFCDGNKDLEEYLIAAIDRHFKIYGYSSHAPVPFENKWSMKQSKVSSYLRHIDYLKQKWAHQIDVLKGMEVDYIPGICGPKSDLIKSFNLDYTIGSVHYVDFLDAATPWEIDGSLSKFQRGLEQIFNNDIQAAIERYYQLIRMMVREETPTIVGHLDKIKIHNTNNRYFQESDEWYRKVVLKTLQTIKISGSFIEVNTRGFYKNKCHDFYPSNWILEEILDLEIPIVLNTDAHQPIEIDKGIEVALVTLRNIGFSSSMQYIDGQWRSCSLLPKSDSLVA